MKKRMVSLVLALVMAMALFPASAWAVEIETVGDFQISEDGYLLHYTGTDTSVVIPDGVKVIGKNAFSKCTTMEELVIPDSVEEIQYAFNDCVNLRRVTVGSGVTTVADMLFARSRELEEVICSPELDFTVAVNLQGFRIEGTKITGRTNCEPSRVTIPEGVTEVDFGHAGGLVSISLPDSVTAISDRCFVGGDVLERIGLGSGLKTIGKSAFKECTAFTSLTLPDGLVSIGEGAFESCTGLTSVVIPDSVTFIGDGAFKNCKNLTSVVLPSGAVQMGNQVFLGCDKLDNLSGDEALDWTDAAALAGFEIKLERVSYSGDSRVIDEAVLMGYHGAGGDVVIPDGVTGIAAPAFRGNTSITGVVMPDSVTNMAYMVGSDYVETFQGCTNLRSVRLSGSLTEIPDRAFKDCTSLKELVIPEGVTWIGRGFIDGCTVLEKLVIPEGMPPIGSGLIDGCPALKSYTQGGVVKKLEQNDKGNVSELTEDKRQAEINRYQNSPAYQKSLDANSTFLAEHIEERDYIYTIVTDDVQRQSDQICAGLTSDEDKVAAIHDWMTANIYYDYPLLAQDHPWPTAQTVLDRKAYVCSGYTTLFQALCWAQKIPCVCVSGMAGGHHAWNAVQVDGEWSWVDATWDTTNGYYGGDNWEAGTRRNDYFRCSSEYISIDHTVSYASSHTSWGGGVQTTTYRWCFTVNGLNANLPDQDANETSEMIRQMNKKLREERALEEKEHFNQELNDHVSPWARSEVATAYATGLYSASMRTNFNEQYTRPITRAEFCVLVVDLVELAEGGDFVNGIEGISINDYLASKGLTHIRFKSRDFPFTDIKSYTLGSTHAIPQAYSMGIINGTSRTTFSPNDYLTREQAATMLMRAGRLLGLTTGSDPIRFRDNGQIGDWAKEGVDFVTSYGIMNGVGDNNFDPQGRYTREQALVTIVRMYNAVKEKTDS